MKPTIMRVAFYGSTLPAGETWSARLHHEHVRRLYKPVDMSGVDERNPILDTDGRVLVFLRARVDRDGALGKDRRLHDRLERQDRGAHDRFFLCPLMRSVAID